MFALFGFVLFVWFRLVPFDLFIALRSLAWLVRKVWVACFKLCCVIVGCIVLFCCAWCVCVVCCSACND